MALFLLIPALIIFFLVLRKEYLRLDQVRITISGLCLFFSLRVEVVCRGLKGWGAKLRLRYIWLGAQAYIFPWCLLQIFCLQCLVLSGVVGSWFLILKKCPILAVTLIGWCQDMQELYIYLGACLHLKCICFIYSQLFFRTFFAYLLLHHPHPHPHPPPFSMIIILQGRDLPQKILRMEKRH